MIIDDFVTDEFFIDDNSIINVSLMDNGDTISDDKGD